MVPRLPVMTRQDSELPLELAPPAENARRRRRRRAAKERNGKS